MSQVSDPEEPDFDAASLTLNEGLRSCRAVITGYRSLLSPEADNDDDGPHEIANVSNE